MISFFILKGFVLFVVRTIAGLYTLEADEWNVAHLVALTTNIISTDLSTLVAYQFVFVTYSVQCVEVFVSYAAQQFIELQFRKCVTNTGENIQLIEDLANLHSQLSEAFAIINATFSKEVNFDFNF